MVSACIVSLFFPSYFSTTGTGCSAGRKRCFQENKTHSMYAVWLQLLVVSSSTTNTGQMAHRSSIYLLKNVYTNIPLMHDFDDGDYFLISLIVLCLSIFSCYFICEIQSFYFFLDNLSYSNSTVCVVRIQHCTDFVLKCRVADSSLYYLST